MNRPDNTVTTVAVKAATGEGSFHTNDRSTSKVWGGTPGWKWQTARTLANLTAESSGCAEIRFAARRGTRTADAYRSILKLINVARLGWIRAIRRAESPTFPIVILADHTSLVTCFIRFARARIPSTKVRDD